MRRMLSACSLVGLVLLAGPLCGQEWTRFRGPNGTGISSCSTIPVKWSESDYCWKAELPGAGYSSPVVWRDKVFVLSARPDDATRYVLCYSAATGERLWMREFKSSPYPMHARNSYASSSPAVDAQHVYVAWATPAQLTLKAFDHLGTEVWSRDLGPWVGQHGFGTSPIVYQSLVILHNAQDKLGLEPGQKAAQDFMMAFDGRTGRDVWRTPLETTRVCYSVPFIRETERGEPELVCTNTGNGFFALDPATGKMRWSFKAFPMRIVNSPIAAGGVIFGSNGSGGYSGNFLVAVRPGVSPEMAYTLKNSGQIKVPYVTCFLAKGDDVFLIYDKGFAACLHAPTGKIRWSHRTDGAFSGSPVLAGQHLYCIDEDGVVFVLAADPSGYRLLAKNPLGEPSRSTPAISGGRMFLRTLSHLYCIGGNQPAGQ